MKHNALRREGRELRSSDEAGVWSEFTF